MTRAMKQLDHHLLIAHAIHFKNKVSLNQRNKSWDNYRVYWIFQIGVDSCRSQKFRKRLKDLLRSSMILGYPQSTWQILEFCEYNWIFWKIPERPGKSWKFPENHGRSQNIPENPTGGPHLVRILGPGKNRTSEIRTTRYYIVNFH